MASDETGEPEPAGAAGGARRRFGLYGLAGASLLGAAGALYYIYREKSVEKPRHRLVERDGRFEVRDYPELLIAETAVAGEREQALDQGFGRLADYIFARSRGGEKVAMTAPVFSLSGGDGIWLTRFVMPARFTRDTLPEPAAAVRIDTIPARRVAAIRFAGVADEAALAAREAELRSWLAARKLAVQGEPERAFYNSPFMPAPLRRTEVLLAIA